jgi:DNA processing protein
MSDPAAERAAGYAAALAALPGMGPATLVDLLDADDPAGAWRRVRAGEIGRPEPRRSKTRQRRTTWAEQAERIDPAALAEAGRAAGIQVTWWGDDRYPAALCDDPQPPGVLFWRGDLSCLKRPCVALVGTRRATHDGRAIAFELGRDLAAAGVCVISGLALGIDGAAHAGALTMPEGSTVGVAASGVDVPYPPRHARLWEQLVASQGAVCSETPPGQPAQAWRFPSRNRVIAGLSRLVVVVESHATGGSLLTVEAALARGIDVAAVPGPVRSPASAGTNQLLTDGPAPVRHAGDVLDLLGRVAPWPPPGHHRRPRRLARRPLPTARGAAVHSGAEPMSVLALSDEARLVLDAVGWRSVSLNRVVEASGLAVGTVAARLDELEAQGLVAKDGAWWRLEEGR